MIRIEQNDALNFLASLPAESVDLFITDAAYESMEKHRATGTTTRLKVSKMSSNKWFPIFGNHLLPALLNEMHRIMKKASHAYLFCDDETSDWMKRAAKEAGFLVWKRLVWDKMAIGTGYHWRGQCEFILFIEKKPQRQLNSKSMSDLLRHKRVHKGYPAEKPVSLIKELVENSSAAGDVVCDCFLGSGATAVAAIELGRSFVGCDIQEDAVILAQRRALQASRLWRK